MTASLDESAVAPIATDWKGGACISRASCRTRAGAGHGALVALAWAVSRPVHELNAEYLKHNRERVIDAVG